MRGFRSLLFLAPLMFVLGFSGCMIKSYPSERIKEDLAKICKQEYGIENLDVKISGDTIGVFLPLKKLFAADFKEAAITGKVRNLETLFEPSPQALERIEDVLFSISRVLLSTDREFKFYVMQATDIEKTGLQLVLTGYVDDIRRVRIWDISRGEYRKRVVHELRLNRAVRWHQPVRAFFNAVENLDVQEIRRQYFNDLLPAAAIQGLFLNRLNESKNPLVKTEWNIIELKSAPFQKNEVLVYAKVSPRRIHTELGVLEEKPAELRYLFMFAMTDEQSKLLRIVPFQYQDDNGELHDIPFPEELQINKSLDQWDEEFKIEDIQLGPFLADQLTRRFAAIMVMDERLQNTFRVAKVEYVYQEEDDGKGHFDLNIEATLKDFNNYTRDSIVSHEDMLYLLQLASREFVDVTRSYSFGDYSHLNLQFAQEPTPFVIERDSLELFRRNKQDIQGILSPSHL